MPSQLYTVDASGRSWGRVASEVAQLLRGKRHPQFTPNLMPEVTVKITNIRAAAVSLRDREKRYYRYSGYPGGLKTRRFGEWFDKNPEELFRHTVKRMLPGNRLRDRIIKHLKFS